MYACMHVCMYKCMERDREMSNDPKVRRLNYVNYREGTRRHIALLSIVYPLLNR